MKKTIEQLLLNACKSLQDQGLIPNKFIGLIRIERSKDLAHGDFATNFPLVYAKQIGLIAKKFAELLVLNIATHTSIRKIEIAGPGFINFFVSEETLLQIIPQIFDQGMRFGCSHIGQGSKVLLEFVSANPTGPLHVGHGRSAAFGATLANVLAAVGFDVHTEYYVNDAGRQMNILAVSVWLRYLNLLGETVILPNNAYKGEYVIEIAAKLLPILGRSCVFTWEQISVGLPLDATDGGDKEQYIDAIIARVMQLLGIEGFKTFHQHALNEVLQDIKDDLTSFGVNFSTWFSEQSLLDIGAIERCIQALQDQGCTYLKDGALWFKATIFGDEKDRVLVRANGQNTYFASDVAYHWDKYARGFNKVIDIFGADHHGYVARISSAIHALGHDTADLIIILVQFAILYRGNERIQMSTRSGSFVTLRELRSEVGNDAARFFYVMRKPDQHMDFDLELAKSQSNDNPVYYVQYAHARICSVMRQLKTKDLLWDAEIGLRNLNQLQTTHEIYLINLLWRYAEIVEIAAAGYELHQIANYLRDLATALHSYYNAVQLLCENYALRSARLCLIQAVRQILYNGLQLLGVTAPERM